MGSDFQQGAGYELRASRLTVACFGGGGAAPAPSAVAEAQGRDGSALLDSSFLGLCGIMQLEQIVIFFTAQILVSQSLETGESSQRRDPHTECPTRLYPSPLCRFLYNMVFNDTVQAGGGRRIDPT